MKNTKKNNRAKITDAEIKSAATGLTMDNFFAAVKEIRLLGVLFHDEEHDVYWREPVNVAELAEQDPDVIKPDDSLESILYGVFDVIRTQESPDCETCGFFRDAYRFMSKSKVWKQHKEAWAHRALVDALQAWLRIGMEEILVKKVLSIPEEEVLKRCQELDRKQVEN